MRSLKQTEKWVFGLTLLAGTIGVVRGDGTAEISSYSGKETNLSIPGKLDGHTVKSIRDCAF